MFFGQILQFAVTVAQIVTPFILIVTLIAIWRSMKRQNELFRSQLLRDRFDMYMTTWEPVADNDVEEFNLYPDLYRDGSKDLYYRENIQRIKRCIGMAQMYEYLAFAWSLKAQEPDLLGGRWIKQWIKDLVGVTEFLDCHEYFGEEYYPEFYREVQKEVDRVKKETSLDSIVL